MNQTAPWVIYTKVDDIKSDEVSACIQCSHADQTIQKDGFTVVQSSKCQYVLSKASVVIPDQFLTYLDSPYPHVIGNGWDSYFNSTDANKCPITKCELKAKGCIEPFISDNVSIRLLSPWYIYASRSTVDGYKETFCVSCSNGFQEMVSHEITVTLWSKCLYKLKDKVDAISIQNLSYSSKESTVKVGSGVSSFFKNVDVDSCPVKSCDLMDEDCSKFYTGNNIILDRSTPFQMTAKVNIGLGYFETICLQCSNG